MVVDPLLQTFRAPAASLAWKRDDGLEEGISIDRLPTGGLDESEETIFRLDSIPKPVNPIETSAIYCELGTHDYFGNMTVKVVRLYGRKEAFRALGLWVISCLLQPVAETWQLRLLHSRSTVTNVYLSTRERAPDQVNGLQTQPIAASYLPGLVDLEGSFTDRLVVRLVDDQLAAAVLDDDQVAVELAGSDEARYWLACSLLELSQEWFDQTRLQLEGPQGWGGVDAGSAELAIHLPGDNYWDPEAWS